METTKKYWIGEAPTHCDICTKPLVNRFVDGKTNMVSWANMCMACFKQYGVGVGLGKGQQYTKQTNGQWLKVRG